MTTEVRDYFHAGDRVEYRRPYASAASALPSGTRGTVVKNAPLSLITGVVVQWDTGEERCVETWAARKLGILELLAEL